MISKLLASRYGGDEAKVPREAYLSRASSQTPTSTALSQHSIRYSTKEGPSGSKLHCYDILRDLPSHGDWLQTLSGPKASWLRAFLTGNSVVQGARTVENQAARVFAPRQNQRVQLTVNSNDEVTNLQIFGGIRGN